MPGLSLALVALGLPALLLQSVSVALARALRTYSRSRLEEVCERVGVPDRVEEIERGCEDVERAAETLGILGGFLLATLAGILLFAGDVELRTPWLGVVLLLAAILGQVVAGAVGRVWAESLLVRVWPATPFVRILAAPLTGFASLAEGLAERAAGLEEDPRPASVEVEIPPDLDHPEDEEPELPESIRDMLERVVELTRRQVSDLMRPRGSILQLSDQVDAETAARAFASSGYSRIPLFGETRDDIVGVLYAKDLLAALHSDAGGSVEPRRLARPPYLVPDTMQANQLLADFRRHKVQMAIVLDEYGAVVGLATFEDLIEQIVGPVSDEHDQEVPGAVVDLGESTWDVAATLPVEDLEEHLRIQIPRSDDVETVAGLAFHHFGRLPETGASFDVDGVSLTVTEVVDRSIRRVRVSVRRP
ncbi:MAG: hemolysin family protein [Isosphaeraceae bacterium]|nr:hemolysin family protein [Isosphaeraceae bacterium]